MAQRPHATLPTHLKTDFVYYDRLVHSGRSVPAGRKRVATDPQVSIEHGLSVSIVTEGALDPGVTEERFTDAGERFTDTEDSAYGQRDAD
jgi:hypothetical protein